MLRLFLAILFFASAAQANPLTWDDCVRILMRENPELQAQLAIVDATRFSESGSYNGFLPHLSANVAYNRSGADVARPASPDAEGYTAGVSLSQNLFGGFGDLGRVKQAEANTVIAESNLRLLKARLSKELKTAFENILYAKRLIGLQTDIVNRRQDNVRLVNLRFQGGRENRGSVLQAQAALSESRLEELQARLALRTAKADLGKMLGLDDIATIDVIGAAPISDPGPEMPSLKNLAAKTPEVEKSIAEEEAAKAGVTVSRSNFYPTLTLSHGIGTSDTTFFPNENKSWNTSLSLNFPFFDGGRDYYAARASSKVYLAAIQQRTRAQQDKLYVMESSYGNYLQAVERLKVNEALLEAMTVRAEIARAKYNNGMLSFEDWDTIENDLIRRQRGNLEGKRDRVVAEAVWELTQGIGVLP